MKKFVTAVLSVLLVASMATAAMATAFVPSVQVKEVEVDNVLVYTDAEGKEHEIAVITDGSELKNDDLAIRITMIGTSLDDTKENGLTDEQNAFAADVFNGMAEAESLAAYLSGLKGFEAETADLTGYVASAIFTVEASDAVKALLGDQKFAVTLKVAGVEEGMEVVAPILTAGEDGAVEYTSNAATATADGVETTVNPFGVMVVAVKNA